MRRTAECACGRAHNSFVAVGKLLTKGALLAALVASTATLGCLGPHVVVLPTDRGVVADPRSPSCKLEFFRAKPDQPFEELAALHASGGDTFKNGPDAFLGALREKACELGADAVIVTQEYSGPGKQMNAVAIRFRAPSGMGQ